MFWWFGSSLVLGDVLIEELLESWEISLTFVALSGFVTSWVPFKSWVSSDLNTIGLVDSSVEFGNDDVSVILVSFTKLIPNWGKLFAVTAPWSVEFDEDIFSWVHNDFLEFSSDNNDNVTLGLWDGSGFEMWFDGSIFDSSNEGANGITGKSFEISIINEFLHVSWEKSSKSWEIFLSNSHEFSEFTLDLVGGTSIREKHFSLVGNGGLFESFLHGRFAIGFSSEEKKNILLLSENSLDLIFGELENGWDHEWFDEGKEGIFISGSGVDDGFLLELSEEDKGWLLSSEFGGASGISVVDESNFLLRIGKFDVSFSVESIGEVGSEESNGEFISSGLFFKSIAGNFKGWWSGFLEDP